MIEWLDHDDYFAASYFNSSIETLFSFLIIYRDFIKTVNGDNFTDEQFSALKNKMRTIDEKALSENGFWEEMLGTDLLNRGDFLANG
jgi:hypothetical protein